MSDLDKVSTKQLIERMRVADRRARIAQFAFLFFIGVGIITLIINQSVTLNEIKSLSESSQEKLEEIKSDYFPLEFDKNQNVLREPPTFHLDEPVVVEATFRNTDSKAVTFTGAVHWQLVDPNEGKEVLQFEFSTSVPPGCKEFIFENHAPKEVIEITNNLFARGVDKVTWKLFGDNIIVGPIPGGSVSFEVEPFTYIPNEATLPKNRAKPDETRCE